MVPGARRRREPGPPTSEARRPAATPRRRRRTSTTSPPTWAAWASSRTTRPLCMLSVLINTHMLMAARDAGVERFFFGSSACVYAADKQTDTDVTALKEEDAYPAMPEDGYGWEKLFSERMCRHFSEDFGISSARARFHNVYGPYGTWDGGREKAPAAICRKVIQAQLDGSERDRDLGRRQADAELHVHRRLRSRASSGSWTATSASRSTSARRAGDDQRARRHGRGHRRRSSSSATTT